MKLIPSTPRETNSSAERRVFDRLRTAFRQDQSSGREQAPFELGQQSALTAFHSLNLTRHAYKRFGEIDFVIVGPDGILVLEVKGGGIACHDGVWSTSDRGGALTRLKESPFRQAELAMHGLRSRLESALPPGIVGQFLWGYGVVFPDCDWSIQGAEWDQPMVADARASRNMASWLSRLYRYWQEREGRRRAPASADALTQVIGFLRPEVDVGIPLHCVLDELETRVASLTEEQMALLDIVDANARVLCSGGAGTGKTFLALELARRWAASGWQVLLACQSPWLKHWLEKHFAIAGVSVSVAQHVRSAARRAGLDRFDALILDEGQDLLTMDRLRDLDGILCGGLQAGRWCFFHDVNHQAGYFGPPDAAALALLASFSAAKMPLRRNCRNTRQIMEAIQSRLGLDMGARGTGDGPEVVHHQAKGSEEAAKLLASELERLIDRGGLSPSEITILSPQPFADSTAARLAGKHAAGLIELDEFALRHFPPAKVSFAEIASFKGLENEAVILVDLPQTSSAPRSVADQYVGMSRARSLLIIIVSEVGG
ncbi:NERD domain-containing protein [Halochromatium roseum]|uniref:NERD domain-containing protein n=1 Tax=Halochromatium roseum TaxID=391920 RepID=UPI001911E0F8|nr:NERD domain-containing protein [Halochromatium roseum]MBK5939093.1 nuclease [Halochromatium roseum]